MKVTIVLLVLTIAVFAVAASAQDKEATEGKTLFQTNCAMCHGPDGAGNTPVGKNLHIVDLRSAPVQKNTDAQLTSIIENGKNKMPAFKSRLKPEQVKDLVAYVRELGKGAK
jgi:cytochrome c6